MRLRRDYGVKASSTIYTTVLSVSRSGMTRTIKTTVTYKGNAHDVSHLVAAALGRRWDRDRGGVVVGGCGMDMTFEVVYALSRALWPKGHKCNGISEGKHRCPSNDHSNDYGARRRIALDEIRAEAGSDDVWEDDVDLSVWNAKVEDVTERFQLDYVKGRHHTDGGYVLNRSHL